MSKVKEETILQSARPEANAEAEVRGQFRAPAHAHGQQGVAVRRRRARC
jgi:hypothetical protein